MLNVVIGTKIHFPWAKSNNWGCHGATAACRKKRTSESRWGSIHLQRETSKIEECCLLETISKSSLSLHKQCSSSTPQALHMWKRSASKGIPCAQWPPRTQYTYHISPIIGAISAGNTERPPSKDAGHNTCGVVPCRDHHEQIQHVTCC